MGGKLVKGVLATISLLFVVVVAIAVLVPPPDEPVDASEPADTSVPLLLGDDVTHNEVAVSAAEFGVEWPLTVDSGTVVCEAVPATVELMNVFFVDEGQVIYAVNGTASSTIEAHGWRDIEEIWKADQSIGGRVNISPIIEAGLDICEPAPPPALVPIAETDQPTAELMQAAALIIWEAWTPEERSGACYAWEGAPDAARSAFVLGADGDDSMWPALEAVLRERC